MITRNVARQAERGLLGFFILWLVWLPLPLASNRPWSIAVTAAAVWVLLALAGLLQLFAQHRPVAQRSGWGGHFVLTLLLLYTAWTGLQLSPWGYTEDVHETRLYVLRCVGYVGAFWFIQLLVTSDRRRTWLLSGLLGAGVIQAMIAVVLFSGGARYELMGFNFVQGQRATGTFTGPDALADYMLQTLAAGLAVMLVQLGQTQRGSRTGSSSTRGKRSASKSSSNANKRQWEQRIQSTLEFVMSTKMLVRIALVIMVITLVMTRSRMGNGAFFLGLFLMSGWLMLASPQLRRPTAILVASLLVVDLVVIGQWVGLSKVIDRMQATEMALAQAEEEAASAAAADPTAMRTTPTRKEESLHERLRPVRDAMVMLQERPWLGFGGGAFYTAFPRYKVESLDLPYNHAHNDYVEIIADVGLPGFGCLALAVLLSLWRAAQLINDRVSPHVRGVAAGMTMGVICALLHALVDLNLQINANAMTLTVLLAVIWSVPRPVQPSPVTSSSSSR